jgi:vitamin B12 transporter
MALRSRRGCLWTLALFLFCPSLQAVIVHGTVTNPIGLPVIHANVLLEQNGQVIAIAVTHIDGTYQISSSAHGRFYVLVSATNFKQITSQSFYGGAADSHQEDVVLEPANLREENVNSATGTPLPEAQISGAISTQRNFDFRSRVDLLDSLRLMPGVFTVRQGEYGGLSSLFIRGSNPDASQWNLDGVLLGDIGGAFDLSTLSTAGLGQLEVYRGPNSVLYGSDASAGVVSLISPQGSTNFPSLFYEGDAGTFTSFRNLAQVGGTWKKLDYYGGFDAFQSDNSLPINEFHNDTAMANLGYAWSAATELRVMARNSDVAVGTPGPFNFYGISSAGKRSNQETILGASWEHRTLSDWHTLVRYGMTRKREEEIQFYPAGIPLKVDGETNYYGFNTVIKGANGDTVIGQAILNFNGTYPNTVEQVSNRDQVYFQTDYPFMRHILGLFAFGYEDERGAKKSTVFGLDQTLERRNYDYTAQIQGSFKHRVFYSLGGGAEKNGLFGTVGTPRLGLVYYPVQPGRGLFRGTKIRVNFANGYQEPSLDDQFGSLYSFLQGEPGGEGAIQQFHITPIVEEQVRTYEGGVAQSFINERGLFRVSVFRNQYGRQIEPVPATEVPALLPQLDASERQTLESFLSNAGDLDLNSQKFRAQGIESQVEFSLFSRVYLRGGYTYLAAVVQHSFTSDALEPAFNPAFPRVPIGAFQPLRGARPFERPPHTGYGVVNYTGRAFSASFTAAIASKSDDSTFLAGRSLGTENSLLLPNRNLDYGYNKLDIAASYQLMSWLGVYGQADNLTGNKKIAPIGYPSLPFTFRAGLRVTLGHSKSK